MLPCWQWRLTQWEIERWRWKWDEWKWYGTCKREEKRWWRLPALQTFRKPSSCIPSLIFVVDSHCLTPMKWSVFCQNFRSCQDMVARRHGNANKRYILIGDQRGAPFTPLGFYFKNALTIRGSRTVECKASCGAENAACWVSHGLPFAFCLSLQKIVGDCSASKRSVAGRGTS